MLFNGLPRNQKAKGYGIALVLIFLATSVAIVTSLQMMSGPIAAAYLGSTSQNNLSAQQLAQTGMNAVVSDIQNLYNTGQTISPSYTYSSASAPGTLDIPQSPDALTGAKTPVGSYSGKILWANGNSCLVKVTATVGSSVYSLSRVLLLSKGIYPLDNVTGATAAYGLRRLKADNTSITTDDRAIRVRRASDNATRDIGFTASGDLDTNSLMLFLSGTPASPNGTPDTTDLSGYNYNSKILDRVTNATAAYSLRKLRTAYTGNAIRVRRSSDSAELDIGFLPNGDLDTVSLIRFVGSGSGYVKIWYDQSGNGRDQSQATTTVQPLIVAAGALVTVNGRPAVRFDGVDDFIAPTTFNITNNFTIIALARPTATQDLDAKNGGSADGTSGQRYLIGPDARVADQGAGFSLGTNGVAIYNHSSGGLYAVASAPLTIGSNPVISTMVYISKQPFLYVNSQLSDVNYPSASTNVYAGNKIGGREYEQYYGGEVSEVIYYPTSLSTANRQAVENSEAMYYFLPLTDLGYTPPLDSVGSASAVYGLRKLLNAYSGNAIQVRRSSDNNTLNIAFDNKGNLDLSSLMAFCVNTSCYVRTWYDQSGSAKNATQTTAANQPRIVNAGVLESQGGRPAVYFDGSANYLTTDTSLSITGTTATAFAYANMDSTAPTYARIFSGKANGDSTDSNTTLSGVFMCRRNGVDQITGWRQGGSKGFVAITPNTNIQLTSLYDGTNNIVFLNGTAGTSAATAGNFGINQLWIGQSPTLPVGDYWKGTISELILYPSALTTANRQILENNQMAYYNLNSRMPDTGFLTTWYDQSGNNYHLTQTNELLQPTIRIDSITGHPTVLFNGLNNFMSTTSTFTITSDKVAMFAVTNLLSNPGSLPRLFSGWATGDAVDWNSKTSAAFLIADTSTSPQQVMSQRNNSLLGTSNITLGKPFQVTSYFDGSNGNVRINSIAASPSASTGNFAINQFWLARAPQSSRLWNGTVSEIIFYASNPTSDQIKLIERDQRSYHAIQ